MEVQRTSSVSSYRLARGTAGEGAAAAGRGGGTEGTARRPVLGGNGGADYVQNISLHRHVNTSCRMPTFYLRQLVARQ